MKLHTIRIIPVIKLHLQIKHLALRALNYNNDALRIKRQLI